MRNSYLQVLAFVVSSIFVFSCGQQKTKIPDKTPSDSVTARTTEVKSDTSSLHDTTVQILWRGNEYNERAKDSASIIVMNESYCKILTDAERAALGYVATFIGNECWWDGDYTDDRSNLKCKILTALDLGYQCSEKHLGFLRKWFRNDTTVMEELEGCPTIPYTATVQNTFDEIKLTVKSDTILVWFSASGVNIREGDSWAWSQTDHFKVDHNKIKLVKADKSKVTRAKFDVGPTDEQ